MRRPPPLLAGRVAAALLLVVVSAATAQTPVVRVEQLRLDPAAHVSQLRTVEGVVERLVDRGPDATPAFYLEDDFGHQILVVPVDAPPRRGSRLTVTGIVTLDPAGDPVITMSGAPAPADPSQDSAAEPPPGPVVGALPEAQDGDGDGVIDALDACPASPTGAPVDADGCPAATTSRTRLIAGVALLAFLLIGGVLFIRHRRQANVEVAIAELWPPDAGQEFDGRTMRFVRPDPTLHLMPGRLEVTGGEDAGEVIRFVGLRDEAIEMTFGRATGNGPTHVQLKEKTVSRRHAVIRNRDGAWWIQNLSRTNPTVLNDQELASEEVALADHDEIEMGEVTFRFRA